MIGPHTLRYGFQVGPADPYALVDDAFLELTVADPAKIRGMAAAQPASEATQMSAGPGADQSRRSGAVGARRRGLLGASGGGPPRGAGVEPGRRPDTTVELAGRSGWLVDLRGAPVAPFTQTIDLGPWRIATLVVDE